MEDHLSYSSGLTPAPALIFNKPWLGRARTTKLFTLLLVFFTYCELTVAQEARIDPGFRSRKYVEALTTLMQDLGSHFMMHMSRYGSHRHLQRPHAH